MTEKIISIWECFKLTFLRIMDNTRAEFNPWEVDNANEYLINGVRYKVTTSFSETENKTMKEKVSAFIGSDFAHLTIADDINTLNTEYVNSTAGEGRINAVR